MFSGGVSCAAAIVFEAVQEALVEAAIKAKSLGFFRILFLCSSERIVQVFNLESFPSWQEDWLLMY